MTFSEALRNLREERKLTQEELARALGVSRSTIGMYEQGKREPDFETEEKLADFFNVTLDYLRTGARTSVHADGQSAWYTDPETARLAQAAFDRPDLGILMDASADLPPESVLALVEIARRMKGSND